MGLKEEVEGLKTDMKVIADHLKNEEVKRVKKKEFKLPFGIKGKAKRAVRTGKYLALLLRNNKRAEFKLVNEIGGLIHVNDYVFKTAESDAVYNFKKLPLVVIYEWRLNPVGGDVERLNYDKNISGQLLQQKAAAIVGGSKDKENAEILRIKAGAEQTIIRGIEQSKLDLSDVKKKKKGNMIMLIIGAVVVIGIIGSMFGLI